MNISHLTFSYNFEKIYDDVSLELKRKDHIGIIGVNGAGKSTLFKLILKELEPEYGTIKIPSNTRISYLPQVITDEIPNIDITVWEYLLSARPIQKLEKEMSSLYTKLAETPNNEKVIKRLEYIQSQLDYWDYYEADSILLRLIHVLKISSELLEQKLKDCSGGQKSKIAFARLLYSKPEIILLDEPTNHLDLETKQEIEEYLKNYSGMVLVISHDIEFLNAVTNKTLWIDKATKQIELIDGNYEKFQKIKKIQEESLERKQKEQAKEIKKLQDIVNLYSNSSGKRKKMAQSREKSLQKLLKQKIELRPVNKKINFKMKVDDLGSMIPIKIQDLTFGYKDNKPLYKNINFEMYRQERFLIIGENGVGKSTLLKLIYGELKPWNGMIKLANKTKIGYYAQEHESLDFNKTILENLEDNHFSKTNIRAHLGNFLFLDDDVLKKVSVLSPGERSRLALAKLTLTNANFLLLDEPTNHLDPETQEFIAEFFKNYPGSIMLVSHNPHFVDKLGIERILLLPSGEIMYYDRKIVEFYENQNKMNKN